jgi:hypothetical protein
MRLPIAACLFTIGAAIALLALPAVATTKAKPAAEKTALFTLTSPALKDDVMLPLKYAGNS